ncbi:BCD family MFS transporter [Hydrogenophaga sp.]|uniref:BCD family MFS transporter n=1 Tax=Hydrogenophaga sp. TaxID=1904254 RepID=UPI00260E25D8|nr:BCD family MFS transporter [Hydrogenophaga sp.]MDM7949895.1 BCD family MFS transporter [Hydrogenophaga sp.]
MRPFGWGSVARLGVVQACLGAIVVLTTSTLNRVMVVELALPALLPGLLVALHYAVQIARPRMGHGSDVGGRRTPWIIGGMAVLALGGVLSALATVWMASEPGAGLALAVLGFSLVGLGVSASGTSLLVLLAKRVPESRRGGAATMVWMMMIAGFALTAGLAGHFLDPYSPERLLLVTSTVSVAAWIISLLAVHGLEGHETTGSAALIPSPAAHKPRFREALAQVWAEPVARRFTIFVFISMLAYSAQDLILEPFAGAVHGYTPGASTQLAGVQHAGVLAGMLMVAIAGAIAARWAAHPVLRHIGSLRAWTVGGCIASALALLGLMLAGLHGAGWPLKLNVLALGVANGAFSIGAIGSMMRLAHEGGPARAGIRMGLWGAAQAMAFGIGGLIGTGASDLAHHLLALPGSAYATVFALESAAFLLSAVLAWRISTTPSPQAARTRMQFPTPASP